MNRVIIQLSDLHLLSDIESTVREVPTWRTLSEVLSVIRQRDEGEFQLVITGDLAQAGERVAYERLAEWLQEWRPRCLVVPGNHDHRSTLRDVFDLPRASSAEDPDSICFSEPLGEWRLIGVDSQIPGEVGGALSAGQLEWLESELASQSQQPTILFMHHPPFSVDSTWADAIGLANQEAFWQTIERFPQVRSVVSGHVHQQYSAIRGDVLCLTTPATSFQFKPGSESAQFDPVSPGFRLLVLREGRVDTEVVRLPRLAFPPRVVEN